VHVASLHSYIKTKQMHNTKYIPERQYTYKTTLGRDGETKVAVEKQ